MPFIESVKRVFNIGGVSIDFDLNRNIAKQSAQLIGKVVLQSKGERHVKKIHIWVDQQREVYRSGSKSIENIKIGSMDFDVDYMMKAGDKQVLDFSIQLTPQQGLFDKLSDKVTGAMKSQGGILGQVGTVGAVMENAQTHYVLNAKAQIEGTILNPNEATQIKLL